MFKEISEKFYNSNFSIENLIATDLQGNKLFVAPTLYDKITIRRTDNILKRTLNFGVFSRDDEVRQAINLLKTENNGFVFRCDIEKFFESVSFSRAIDLLQANNFSNQIVIEHLRSIEKHCQNKGVSGLPRGLPISSTLAEYYLCEFDKKIYNIPSCSYYCRYVDDILIVHYDKNISVENEVEKLLRELGLRLNSKKTISEKIGTKKHIDFLGYSISVEKAKEIRVAEKKIGKTKKRITLAFKSFVKDGDFELLLDRLRFLAGTTRLRKAGRRKPVLSGFKNVYRHCTDALILIQMQELDSFKLGLLYSKRYNFSAILRTKLTEPQMTEIRKISFRAGWEKNYSEYQAPASIVKIKEAWMYE
jgi:hypothetical protein